MPKSVPASNAVRWLRLAALLGVGALAGCNRDEPRVYHIPKDDSTPTTPDQAAPPATDTAVTAPDSSSPPPADTVAPTPDVPQLKYQLPAGWQEKAPSQMRVASFSTSGPSGKTADIGVIPLPIVGRDLDLVNMWRSQVELPPATDPAVVQQAKPVAIGSDQGRLFEFVSDHPVGGPDRQRVLIAMLTRGTMSWFFRMSGADAFVASQKDKFLQFLKSVSFEESAPDGRRGTSITTVTVSPGGPAALNENANTSWTIPPGWQVVPPAQFLLAEFSITGANGAKAEVNVAKLDGEGGGTLANVNRWRGQLGLDPVSDANLSNLAQPLKISGGKATLVDFTGTDAKTGKPTRLVGAIVEENNQTWFYKLMGDKDTVAQQKDTFRQFVQSANDASAR